MNGLMAVIAIGFALPALETHINVLGGHAMAGKRLHGALEQALGDEAVELGNDHSVLGARTGHHAAVVRGLRSHAAATGDRRQRTRRRTCV